MRFSRAARVFLSGDSFGVFQGHDLFGQQLPVHPITPLVEITRSTPTQDFMRMLISSNHGPVVTIGGATRALFQEKMDIRAAPRRIRQPTAIRPSR